MICQYIRRHKMYYFCLFTAGLYFGDVLHNVYINFLAALALYALGQWLFITALTSWQCLYQRELIGPMRWVKGFFCYIDRWFVFVKRQDHNLIVHLVFKIALHSMHRKLIGWGNETAISCRTQVFNGFWMIINRPINCPTIACTCMRTELWFCTILILVHIVSRKTLYIWHNDGAKKKSEC